MTQLHDEITDDLAAVVGAIADRRAAIAKDLAGHSSSLFLISEAESVIELETFRDLYKKVIQSGWQDAFSSALQIVTAPISSVRAVESEAGRRAARNWIRDNRRRFERHVRRDVADPGAVAWSLLLSI